MKSDCGMRYRMCAISERVICFNRVGEERFHVSFAEIESDDNFCTVRAYIDYLDSLGYQPLPVGNQSVTVEQCKRDIEKIVADALADDNAEMLRKDAEGFASAKPFVKPTPACTATPTPHACIAGLTRVAGLSHLLGVGVR